MTKWAVVVNEYDFSKHVVPSVGGMMKNPHTDSSDCECGPTWNGDSWMHHDTWVHVEKELERIQ